MRLELRPIRRRLEPADLLEAEEEVRRRKRSSRGPETYRFDDAGGLGASAPIVREAAGVRSEVAVAAATGLPRGRTMRAADVGEMIEVRYRSLADGYRDLCLVAKDERVLERVFVLVWPAPEEPLVPAVFDLVGYLPGRVAWDSPDYIDRRERRYIRAERLRPFDELLARIDAGELR